MEKDQFELKEHQGRYSWYDGMEMAGVGERRWLDVESIVYNMIKGRVWFAAEQGCLVCALCDALWSN